MYDYFIEKSTHRSIRHALKQADVSIFDEAISFLIDDPRITRSGYLKEMIWKYITRYPLTPHNIGRLENAALNYLNRPMTREFSCMCRTMARIGTENFWKQVAEYSESETPIQQINAYCLNSYVKSLEDGEKLRLWLKSLKWRYRQYEPYYWGSTVLEIVQQKELWQNAVIKYKQSDPEVVIYYLQDEEYDNRIAMMDYRYSDAEQMLSRLQHILRESGISSALDAQIYTLYIFGEIGSSRYIPEIISFYESKVAYKFDSGKKWIATQAVCRALERIGTPEAIGAAQLYEYPDTPLARHLRSFVKGWLVNK